MAGVLNWFSFATVTTIVRLKSSCYNENAVKITAFWLWAWKKWFLEKGIAKEIENYEPAQLYSSDSTPKLKKNMVKPRKQRFHFIESDSEI